MSNWTDVRSPLLDPGASLGRHQASDRLPVRLAPEAGLGGQVPGRLSPQSRDTPR
jgi:hypothetical protein